MNHTLTKVEQLVADARAAYSPLRSDADASVVHLLCDALEATLAMREVELEAARQRGDDLDAEMSAKVSALQARIMTLEAQITSLGVEAESAVWLRQRVAELEAQSVPTSDTGRTHWEGCHTERGHHGCALRELADAQAFRQRETARADAANERAHALHERWIRWIGSDDATRVRLIAQWASEREQGECETLNETPTP